jgi:hypothetical protein
MEERIMFIISNYSQKCTQDSELYGPGMSIFKLTNEQPSKTGKLFNCKYHYIGQNTIAWNKIINILLNDITAVDMFENYDWAKHCIIMCREIDQTYSIKMINKVL